MTDKQLLSFVKIKECGSFSKAEAVLFLSKQALKKQIDVLEEELGFKLIERTYSGIVPTPAGEMFYQGIKKILADTDALTQRCKGVAFNNQTLRISNPSHSRLVLEKAFDEFARQFPSVSLHIMVQKSENLVDDILNDYTDLAECVYHERYMAPGIGCTKIFSTHYHCLTASSHPLTQMPSVAIKNLTGMDVYVSKNDSQLLSELRERGKKVNIHYLSEGTQIHEILNLCYNNGVFISKASYLTSLSPLISIPMQTKFRPVVSLLHRENPSPIVQEFIKVAQSLYQDETFSV